MPEKLAPMEIQAQELVAAFGKVALAVRPINKRRRQDGCTVSVKLSGWKHPVEISVCAMAERKVGTVVRTIKGYGINWPAIGTVSVDDATAFAAAFAQAIAQAREMTEFFVGTDLAD